MSQFRCALGLARRELRGGVRGFRVFLACLVLGVGTIAAIGSLGAAVEAGLRADAKTLLGGDVAARLALRPAGTAERAWLAASGRLSEIVTLRAMARSPDGDRRTLIELQAVDAAYPLYGAVTLAPAGPVGAALQPDGDASGAVAEAAVAERLGIAVGDEFRIGEAVVRLRATIAGQPDAAFAGIAFGPRVILSQAALARTGLIQPGTLVNYEYRLRLPAGSDPAAWIRAARAAFPDAGWQLRGSADASPSLKRLFERVGFFLNLVGVTALLVGGVGIGNAVAGYIAGKTEAIATLKCLGASTRLVFAAYGLQILALALAGIAGGMLLGTLAPVAAAALLKGVLPASVPIGVYPRQLAMAALCGLLATALFALWPLAAVGRCRPGRSGEIWRPKWSSDPGRSRGRPGG